MSETPKSYRAQFFQASCRECRRTFSIPSFEDQLMAQIRGQLILYGRQGSTFGYLAAFEEPAWQDIIDKLRQMGLLRKFPSPNDDRRREVIAVSADAIDGQPLTISPICPSCYSESVDYDDSKPLDVREIPCVTFQDYQSIPEEQKAERLYQLWGEAGRITQFYITAPNPRPDFRLVIAFLWHDGKNVDTEGDCKHPADRDWTGLYVANREDPSEPSVTVNVHQRSPLVLIIESESRHIAARVAYFLATQTGGKVSLSSDGDFGPPEQLLAHVEDFDVEAALQRAAASPFSRATREHPYPNLDKI